MMPSGVISASSVNGAKARRNGIAAGAGSRTVPFLSGCLGVAKQSNVVGVLLLALT